jgi:hypothetical protein
MVNIRCRTRGVRPLYRPELRRRLEKDFDCEFLELNYPSNNETPERPLRAKI